MAKRTKPILVCIDFSKDSKAVIRQALILKEVLKAPLRILHVEETAPKMLPYAKNPKFLKKVFMQSVKEKHLKELNRELPKEQVKKIKVVFGTPDECIIREAKKIHPQLIMLGSHSHSTLKRLLISSVTESVVHLSKYPVWIQRGWRVKAPQKIIVAYDLSKFSEIGVHFGLKMAKKFKAKLEVLFISDKKFPPAKSFESQKVYDEEVREEEKKQLQKFRKQFSRKYSKLTVRMIQGAPTETLIKLGRPRHADLMVVTTHGFTGLKLAILGSVARQVLSHTSIPMLAIHPKTKKTFF